MKWLTISQIKRRSKTAKGALKVSYEHWNQLYTATAKELREEFKLLDWYNKEGATWWDWKRACKALRDKLKELVEQGN